MRLDSLILADNAEFDEDRKLSITGAGITHVRVSQLPFKVPHLAAVARFAYEAGDAAVPEGFEMYVRWVGPDGSTLVASTPLKIPPEQITEPVHEGESRGVLVLVQMIDVEFEEHGPHKLELIFNNNTVAEKTLAVYQDEGATLGPQDPPR